MTPAEPITLRDQSTTLDPRMDLLLGNPDPRNKNHPVGAAVQDLFHVGDLKPISKTWLAPTCLDQGREGACAAFMSTHLLLNEPGISDPKIFNAEFARQKIYYPSQENDEYPGGEYPGADPVMGGTSMNAVMNQLTRMGAITEHKWAFRFEEFLQGLSYYGPAGVGTVWTTAMMYPDKQGEVRPEGKAVGGHAYTVYGVHMPSEMCLCLNSWGMNNFGIAGRFKIAFKNMEQLLFKWGGEAVFIKKVKPLPTKY